MLLEEGVCYDQCIFLAKSSLNIHWKGWSEVERFYEYLQDVLELTPQKDVLFIIGDWNAKVGSQETPGVTGILALEYGMKQGKD